MSRPEAHIGLGQTKRRSVQRLRRQAGTLGVSLLMLMFLMSCADTVSTNQTAKTDQALSAGGTARAPVTNISQPVSTGMLYAQHCALCHGGEGRGDGQAAYLLFPKPRDFNAGVFRFKSTPGTQLPVADDLHRIMTKGIPRTAMPSFAGVLTDQEIKELGNHVVAMAGQTKAGEPLNPITIPEQPPFEPLLIEEGRKIYVTAGCAACHGETGTGDGPAALALKDSLGYPLPPADFTTGVFKSGDQPEDLYRSIHIGVAGTPMPGFGDALNGGFKVKGVRASTDMTWAMVAYMSSMVRRRERQGAPGGAEIRVQMLADAAWIDTPSPLDSHWDRMPSMAVSLQPLWQRRQAARSVEVRVVRSKKRIAICLEWPDTTFDAMSNSLHGFSDASAVMFALGDKIPSLTMGQRDKTATGEALVNLWQWRADRELNAQHDRLHDVVNADSEAGVPADLYMFKKGDLTKGSIREHDRTYVPAWGVGNPKADPALLKRSVLESNAAGYGTLTLQKVKEQGVEGRAVWSNGRWRAVMVRDLTPGGLGDIDLSSLGGKDRRIPIAFAVWDGSAGDRDGTKLITGWHWLVLSK